jgi:hypothetical protein
MVQVLVSHLCCVHAYSRVVEICLAAAAKRDPQGLALHYYKSGTGSSACRLSSVSCVRGPSGGGGGGVVEVRNVTLRTSTSAPKPPPKQSLPIASKPSRTAPYNS